MAFTVQDMSDLARLLVEHPEWRLELRRLLLSEELLALPEMLRQLAETMDSLVEAQRRTAQQIEELVQVQLRSEARLDRLEIKLAKVEGRTLEQEYREKAPGYFSRLLRKTRVVSREGLADALETHLPVDELHDVLLTDVVVRGQPRQRPELEEVWLALEVSVVVDEGDVTRAGRRAELLRQASYRAIPVVAGENITREAELEVRRQSVLMLQDGREIGWEEALARWGA